MPEHLLFHIAFLFQIIVVSWYLPKQVLGRMRYVLETYPPSTHPKLYARSGERYERSLRTYQRLNRGVAAAGVALLAVLMSYERSGGWDHVIAMWYFLVQMLPVMLLDLSKLRDARLMREATTTRQAELRPRRLLDFVSPAVVGAAIVTYLGFAVLVVYVRQFEFPWFGGYWNIVGATVMNLFLFVVGMRQIRGKKLNPHQSAADRARQLTTIVNMLFFIGIAATWFIALVIALAAFDLRSLQPAAMSVYAQMLAVVAFRVYRVDYADFDVYREHRVTT